MRRLDRRAHALPLSRLVRVVGQLALSSVSACAAMRAPAVTSAPGQLAVDPTREPYRLKLPPALIRAGAEVSGTFQICTDAEGAVARVAVVESADPRVDQSWMTTLKTWRYQPFVVAGNRHPFCHRVRLHVRPS